MEIALFGSLKEKYRVRQVCDWIFHRHAGSFSEMSSLPIDVRHNLDEKYFLRKLKTEKAERSRIDQTVKYTFLTEDHQSFSAVFLPQHKYNSLCVSTQVGCAWKCGFCASGLVPLKRNLSSGEILDQLFLAEKQSGQKVHNILFMGMGEPLHNYDGTLKTIRWMMSPEGFQMSPSRITVSTTGLVPQIKKIAGEQLNVNLALSLHAAYDSLRREIMPVSARFLIKDVLNACKFYQTKNRSDFTIEYILLKNVNDHLEDARELAYLLRSIHFSREPKINLIPYNPVEGLVYQAPDPRKVESFFDCLKRKKINVHTRKPRGQDIDGACGQLL